MPVSWDELNKLTGGVTATTHSVTPKVDRTPTTAKKQSQQGFVERFNILPALGAILGGAAGGIAAGPTILGIPAGVIAGAGGGAFLGEGLEQVLTRKPNVKGLATEAALGAAGGPIGKLLSIPAKGAINLLTGSSRKLIASGLRISPTAFQKAADAGVDLIASYKKFAPKLGFGLDKPLGEIGKRGVGNIDDLLRGAEQTIQSSIKTSGATKRFSVDQLKSELVKHRNLLARIPGNESNIASLDDFVTSTVNKFKAGLSAKQLLDVKRAADSVFGERVLKEEVGSVAAQGQKVLANAARDLLKRTYKNISDALGDEQELILLKKVLGTTRGKVETGGVPTSIGGMLESVLGPVGRTLPAVTGPLRREVPQGIIRGAEQAAFRGPLSLLQGAMAQPQELAPEQSGIEDISTQPAQVPVKEISQYPLENFLNDIKRDPRNFQEYSSLYKLLNPEAGKTAKAGAADEFLDKANQTMDAIEGTEKLGYGPATGRLYEFQVGALGGAGLPEDVVALNQKYTILKLNILRAYQGARISDKDFDLANLYIPKLSDTNTTATEKLRVLGELLTNAQPPQQSTQIPQETNQTDLMQMLGM